MKHPERDFTKAVIETAQRFGWHVAHFGALRGRDGRPITPTIGNAKGYPDLTLVRERIVFAELKIPPNKLTVEQSQWQAKILGAGGEHYVWTPADWDEIDRVLQARRPRPSTPLA